MIEAGERAAMLESVRGAIASAGDDVDTALAELGWLEMLGAELDDAIEIFFSAIGAANATASVLDDVVVSALGREPRADLAVVLPGFAAWQPPGRIEAGEVAGKGLATARVSEAAEVLVVCGSAAEPSLVALPSSAIAVESARGVDPAAAVRVVRVHGSATNPAAVDAGAWSAAVALGRRAVAYEIGGACRAMLDLARDHALERVQFDRPIARFQAVRHRLAEALVAVESLEAALAAARDVPTAETAALAKAVAGRSAHTVARHSQQVLGGIGFTTEHAFHRYLKRTIALEGVLGSADEIALDVGRRLLSERRVPTLIEL